MISVALLLQEENERVAHLPGADRVHARPHDRMYTPALIGLHPRTWTRSQEDSIVTRKCSTIASDASQWVGCNLCGVSLSVLLALTCLAVPPTALETVLIDGVPYLRNPEQPEEGTRVVQLEELWRAGGDDDEVFFGVIREVVSDDVGRLYLLDQQLTQVWVYAPDGEFLRTLSRQGEGPGEVNRPGDCFLLPAGGLGVLDRSPGKVTRVDLQGTPMSSLHIRRQGETGSGSMQVRSGLWRGGTLVLCGQERRQVDGQHLHIGFLSTFSEDGVEQQRLWHHDKQAWDFENRSFTEKYSYFVEDGRGWTIGPRGEVYVARERDRYAVHVYAADGTLMRVIEREFIPTQRSGKDKQRVAAGLTMTINGEVIQLDSDIMDTDPCLRQIHVDEQGQLWVWHARSLENQPEGIFASCDLFAADGRYLAQVQLAVEADPHQDRLIPLSGGRFVLLRGIIDAMDAMWGGSSKDESVADIVPLEVICLRADLSW